MSKKKVPDNFRKADTCTSCKYVVPIEGIRRMKCKKAADMYALPDTVCDEFRPRFAKEKARNEG